MTQHQAKIIAFLQDVILKIGVAIFIPAVGAVITFAYDISEKQHNIMNKQNEILFKVESIETKLGNRIDVVDSKIDRIEKTLQSQIDVLRIELETEKATSLHFGLLKRIELLMKTFSLTGDSSKALQLIVKHLQLEYNMQETSVEGINKDDRYKPKKEEFILRD